MNRDKGVLNGVCIWLYLVVCYCMYQPQISTAFKFLFLKIKKENSFRCPLSLLIVY